MRLLALSAAVAGLIVSGIGPALAACECCEKMAAAAHKSSGPTDQPTMPMMPAPSPEK